MSARYGRGIVGVAVDRDSMTATVRYVPGEVASAAELRRAAVGALRRVARGKVRVLGSEHIGGAFIAGTHARRFAAIRQG